MGTQPNIHVFGVRHLSPSGAWHLRRFLDQVRPKVVLIEGLADAEELIADITRKATKPPIAILAYTDSLPVRTLVYPLARYSPEYQALVWAKENDAKVEFIDLPSDIFLALQDVEEELRQKALQALKEKAEADAGSEDAEGDGGDDADGDTPTAEPGAPHSERGTPTADEEGGASRPSAPGVPQRAKPTSERGTPTADEEGGASRPSAPGVPQRAKPTSERGTPTADEEGGASRPSAPGVPQRAKLTSERGTPTADEEGGASRPSAPGVPQRAKLTSEEPDHTPEPTFSTYEEFARLAGENDYETYWERHFEHNLSEDAYRRASYEFGQSLRDLEQDAPRWRAENLVREAYMRRRIQQTIKSGVKPEKIVAVVGAFHAPVLSHEHPPMTDEELNSLRRRGSKLTLMPYSYFKLSSQSGYGAGNHAPAYFELMWEAMEHGDLPGLPSKYLSLIARHVRDDGTHRSTAEVIEGVRLATTLSAMKDGSAPTLADLRDAAITLIGHGELSTIKDAVARVDVGTAIGELPKGVSRTSIQSDFERELIRLKLEKYKTAVKQDLTLDLRENRRAKTDEGAFLDLNRSSFLHRLRLLEIGFAVPARSGQESVTWAEKWVVQWTPESEIALVEAVLLGETVELATGYKFRNKLELCTSIAEAAGLVRDACQCGLMQSMDLARHRLQHLATESSSFEAVAHADRELGMIARYGDVRKFDPAPLIPLIQELFVQGSLALYAASNCDNDAAKKLVRGMDDLNKVSLEYTDVVEEQLWIDSLQKLADSDDRNPLASGYACAILLERGLIANEDLAREVSRRISPGIPADLGAGWFEGLAGRNRYALLARQPLWEQLGEYVSGLEEDQFRRALVFLRRAFGGFSPHEKRQIAENLGQYWGVNEDEASEALSGPLTEQEEQTLQDLNEFNFDDI